MDREQIAKAEYEMCAGCSNLGTKWEHLKNPEAREAFYHKADQIIAICEEELKVGNALTAELTEEGVKISIDSICKRERKNELERIISLLETFGINERNYFGMWKELKEGGLE